MKELSIEEKARAYDKAIEKIKYVMEHGVSPVLNKEDLQGIFPELAESEDERIRKMCMRYLDREYQHCPFADDKKNIEKCIAWLEKQGEQKPKRMISAEAKEALLNESEREALRTEYEKGRADVLQATVNWLYDVWPILRLRDDVIDAYKEGVVKD